PDRRVLRLRGQASRASRLNASVTSLLPGAPTGRQCARVARRLRATRRGFILMRRVVPALMAAFVVALAAGCGGDDSSSSEKSTTNTNSASEGAKKGGDLSVLYAADVDNIDPGITYYQYGFNVAYATQRPLYSFKPDDATNPEPDLADGPPQITDGGK